MSVKAYELRVQTKQELQETLADLKQELQMLKVSKITGGNAPKLAKITQVRKSIARVLTVMSRMQRDNLRALFKNKKYLPLDLRVKKTRAIRRRLTVEESCKKTLRQKKKDIHFPKRKFAVKA